MELYRANTGLSLMMLGCDIDSQHAFLNMLSSQDAPITDYLQIRKQNE